MKTKTLSIGLSSVLIFCVVLLFSGSAFAAKNVIKLGCAMSFTGSHSRTGKLYVDSYKYAVEAINKAGGVKVDGKNYQLKLVFYDDESKPTESSKLVEKLITEDKVNFLLGPYSSGITIPDSIVARRYRVPMIEGGGASGKIFSQGNKYIFGTLPQAGDYFASTLDFLKDNKPFAKKVAIIYSDDKFDVSVAEGTLAKAKEMGYDVAIYEKYTEGASDFSSVLTKVKSAGINAILVAGHTEEAINFVQQEKELNVSPYILSLTVGPSEADFRKALGKDADYVYGVASWSTQMNFPGYIFKNTATFVKDFKKKFGYDPDYHNASAIADIAVYKDAIERAGSLDREKVRNAIAATNLSTIYGKVTFMDNGQINGTSVVLQILNGEVVQVFPNAAHAAVYPIPAWSKR
ncbi:MAG: amino acid ABC transporter substrate-binding protein [Desulfobacterales bacterium]|jgi:branched-chain amino acid transport system substrate-binding protein